MAPDSQGSGPMSRVGIGGVTPGPLTKKATVRFQVSRQEALGGTTTMTELRMSLLGLLSKDEPGPTPDIFRRGYTYSGHASARAAALANLEITAESCNPS